MTNTVPAHQVLGAKIIFFLVLFPLVFLFLSCGKTKSEHVPDTDSDTNDEDCCTDNEDTDETEDEDEINIDDEENDIEQYPESDKDADDSETTAPGPDEENDTDSTDQKPDDEDDSDSTVPESDEDTVVKPTPQECFDAGGKWWAEYEFCYKNATCDPKPDNSYWNYGLDGVYKLKYENGEWSEPYETEYNEEKGTCHFLCNKNYFWTGSECITPCDPNPCPAIEHSGSTCTQFSLYFYYCDCSAGYSWSTDKCAEITKELTLGNICTGQKNCYNNYENNGIICPSQGEEFFGQDSYYAFLKDTCIHKNLSLKETGIENENIFVENNTELEWQQTISKQSYTWNYAVNYCENLEYGGYNDWRLPSPQEFFATFEHNNATNINICFADKETFWTSKSFAGDSNSAWYINFTTDAFRHLTKQILTTSLKDDTRKIRCVRGKTMPETSLTVSTENGDEIVRDNTSGLIWQKGEASGKTWQGALEYCENLTYAGYSDWRLPNINELASLSNYDRYNPASDFQGISPEYFWSSTTSKDKESVALLISFLNAYLKAAYKSTASYVKCVRTE